MNATEKEIARKAKELIAAWAKAEKKIGPFDKLKVNVSVKVVRGRDFLYVATRKTRGTRNPKKAKRRIKIPTPLRTPVTNDDWKLIFDVGFREGTEQGRVVDLLKLGNNAPISVGQSISNPTCDSINTKLKNAGLNFRIFSTTARVLGELAEGKPRRHWTEEKIKMYHIQ